MDRESLGLTIVIEPDVVPKGTVDLKKLDAPLGTKPPLRRIEPDGRVFMVESTSDMPTGVSVADMPTGAIVTKPAAQADPDPRVMQTVPDLAAIAPAQEPLGLKLRKKSLDTAMPPRPASAEQTASGRLTRATLPEDDYETTQISGGFGSSLWSLLKVTAVLAFFTLAIVFTWLKWNDLLPWGSSASATSTGEKLAASPPLDVRAPRTKAPDAAPVPTHAIALDPLPEAPAKVGTSSAASAVASAKKIEEPPQVAIGEENDYDVRKIEQLRAEAVRLDRAGKYDEALAKLDEILRMNPKDGDALFRRALVFHQKGDYKTAIAAYEKAVSHAAARDARSLNNIGLCYEAKGDLKAAIDAYRRGLDRDPEDPNVLTNLGRLEEDEGQVPSAFARYEKALERDSRHPQAKYHRAYVLALRMDRIAEGKKDLQQLVSADSPLKPEALDALGKVALREHRFADAEQLLRNAIKLRPSLPDAHLYLGIALWQEDQAQPAVEELKLYLEKNPRSADGWKTLGAALVRLYQLQDAKAAYERALALDKEAGREDADTHYNYALCAERFGNFVVAFKEYELVVGIDPNHWKAYTNLGRLYRNAGREEKALEYFDKAIKARPDEPEPHLHRANSLIALGREADARAALARFVELAPPGDRRIEQAKMAIKSPGPLRPAGQGGAPVGTQQGGRPKGF